MRSVDIAKERVLETDTGEQALSELAAGGHCISGGRSSFMLVAKGHRVAV